jgi:hypothetical protein
MKQRILILTLGILGCVSLAAPQEKTGEAEKLGKVHFAVSCLHA